ncbi:interleukin-13 receptor subunit alpha-1 [Chanos chanos]|uniref:Interleukin-13 receptor subunit alpha-1 n=1 Tax=Chanos chanos TaxID=29144 RepID=A0A6J2VXK0_CHACN|nr:interleukin-13 receptor subunit alpha-1-like [Chanos chanos]
MFHRYLDISLFICLSVAFVGVENKLEFLPAPEYVNLSWTSEFDVKVTWKAPRDLDPRCKVNYTYDTAQNCSTADIGSHKTNNLHFNESITTEHGICFRLRTVPAAQTCDKFKSKPVDIIVPPHKALVEDFKCNYSCMKAFTCTWTPVSNLPDLKMYYRYRSSPHLFPCSEYQYDELVKTGCKLSGSFQEVIDVFFLINGTQDGKTVRNTFQRSPNDLVKLKPPKPDVKQDGIKLHFEWTDNNDCSECLKYQYTYKKCNSTYLSEETDKRQVELEYDFACQYKFRVKSIYSSICGEGDSVWSEELIFGEDRDPKGFSLVAFIVIPVTLSLCLILALVLFRRHRHIILPTIPEPALFFKDMFGNKDLADVKSVGVQNLYVPIEEVVESKITLEPEPSQLLNL